MKIEINSGNIVKAGNDILQYNEEFGKNIKQILAIIESINMIWSGDDALKYINIMKEKYLPGLEELNDCIKNYGEYLKRTPDAYQILDEVYSSKSIDV